MFRKDQTWKVVPMPSVTYELTTMACFLSSKPQRHAIFFFFVSFSKDVFLVLVKSETNRVTGKPTMGRARVENRKEGKPWRANWREFIWQLVAVPRTQPDLSRADSYSRFLLPLWESSNGKTSTAKQVWSRQGSGVVLPFLLVRRWQVHRALHSDREHPQLLWLCVSLWYGVARSSVAKCVQTVKRTGTGPCFLWSNERAAGIWWSQ